VAGSWLRSFQLTFFQLTFFQRRSFQLIGEWSAQP
jgi:hypothetical protein